jgi:16S rRNA processing protein RimM
MENCAWSKMPGDYVTVGRITTFHGNRGEVKVMPFTDSLEQFSPGSRFLVTHKGVSRTLEVERARCHKKSVIIKFSGIESIDDAKQLRGATLEVAKSQLVSLPEGEYYVFQIEGLEVVTTEGRRLGKIVRVIKGVAHDIYEVDPGSVESCGQGNILIPAVRDIVKNIDLRQGTVVVDLIPGLE